MGAGRPFGTLIYDNVAELDAGIEAYFAKCEKNGTPPTFEDLAVNGLNISVRTLFNYGQPGYGDESNANYLPSIQRAREKCLAYNSQRLYDKEGSNGAKFYATNNSERMGGLKYADRQEVSMDIAPITFVNDLADE